MAAIMARPATRHTHKIARLVKEAGVLRSRDLARHRIPRMVLSRMEARGEIERLGRGLYALPGASGTLHQSLVEVTKRVPKAVACLLTALSFHEITTQSPFEVWIALPRGAWRPRLEHQKLRVLRFSGASLTAGIETHVIQGVKVRVYNPAKTVADCFKYRNKFGLDVALEALRECWRQKKATMGELNRYAEICRVRNVMRPYLETLVA
jgi:predicted transcriptional regulator of viral defense system